MEKANISIIGLGKLGAPMLVAYASKGYKVVGVDVNEEVINKINQAEAPVFEPQLSEYLSANKERISATKNYEEAILGSDITFVIVPTPSEENGGFSTKYAVEAGKKIGEILKKKSKFHVVVLTSTVTPGSTEKDILTILESESGKKCGLDFGLCYNPEFIALGNVIKNLLNPDFILIGESDSKSGDILEEFYKNVCPNSPVKRMNIVNAEIAKIALNTYVTTKISYSNMMAELCENIPGGDVNVVTDALGCDARIGHKYLKGALGYGGPCFPRDNKALTYIAKKHGVSLPIAEATDAINEKQALRLTDKIMSFLPPSGKVTILGLSYKPDTNVVEKSQGVEIAKNLSEKGINVTVYDPAAMENAKKVLGDMVSYVFSLKESIQSADVICITTQWKEFEKIESSWLKKGENQPTIIDCWKILDAKKYKETAKYISIGVYYGK